MISDLFGIYIYVYICIFDTKSPFKLVLTSYIVQLYCKFEGRVCAHQESVVFCSLFFIIVIEVLLPIEPNDLSWELRYAYDLVLIADFEQNLREKIKC